MNRATLPAGSAETVTLGGDLTVRRLGFGAMRITGRGIWGEPRDREAAITLLRRVVDSGVNLIDTADSYGPEVSERLIAEALYPYPATLVVATKGGLLRPGPDRWVPDCRPVYLRQACEGSLKRLKLDRIDLYQLHTVDPRVPLEESIGALVDLRNEGKIRHIGVSNVNLSQLMVARSLAKIVSVQNRYNLADRTSDVIVDACARDGFAFLPWHPLAAGRIASPERRFGEIADRPGATSTQIALAWLLHRSPMILPIPGTSSIEHFEQNLAAANVRLTDAEFAALGR